jgi:thiol:disulfide interchange protein DsbA
MKRIALIAWIAIAPLVACSADNTEPLSTQDAAPSQQQSQPTGPQEELTTPAARTASTEKEPAAVEAGEGEGAAEPQASGEIKLAQATPVPAPLRTQFTAGRHYQLVNPAQPTSSPPDQIEVAEFFMYTCPHCYSFEPYVQNYLASKPADVNFVRIPVMFNEVAQLHARAYYTAEILGVLDKTHMPMFQEIHVKRNMLASEEQLAAFFERFGVDQATFRKTFNSFAVETKLKQGATAARRFQINSVPNVVVNGKYITGGSMAGSLENLVAIIEELTMIERTY